MVRPAAIGLFALVACTARPTASPPRAPAPARQEPAAAPAAVVPPPSAATAQEPERAYESIEARAKVRDVLGNPDRAPWRGLYRGGGAVRLRFDGPAVGTFAEVGLAIPYPVLESRTDRARMVVALSGVVLLVWVELADFVPQPQEPLVLASAPGRLPADGDGRIEIAPGERVEVIRTQDDWHEVELVRREVRGWLPVAAFAPVFAQGAFPARTQALAGTAPRRTRVFDRPGGKTIWRLPGDGDTEIDIVRETKGWFEVVLVQPCDDTLRVTGFVRRSDVRNVMERGHGGFGCGRLGMGTARGQTDDAIEVTLPEGTELFDDAGQLVGVARKHNVLRRTPDGTLQVPSRWGPIAVVAEVDATPLPPP